MTEAGWTRHEDTVETYADKAATEAVRHVLGAHKLTCDEHENLQQDFKDVAQEAYQQGRVAGLAKAVEIIKANTDVKKAIEIIRLHSLAQQAQGGVGDDLFILP